MTKIKDMPEWIIIRQESPDVCEWYAFNTHTGERKKPQTSYDKALGTVPNQYAEPWGV